MNTFSKSLWVVATCILFVAGLFFGYNLISDKQENNAPHIFDQVSLSANDTEVGSQVTASSLSTKTSAYENEYLKINVLDGWSVQEATQTVSYGTCAGFKENCTLETKVEPNPAAINITKGNYILYVNARTTQASGVVGGRFGEYASGAPSVDAVQIESSAVPCGTSERSTVTISKIATKRIDLYISSSDVGSCNKPTTNKSVWYFSFVGEGINHFEDSSFSGTGWVATMAYNSKAINTFPSRGSSDLNQALSQMTEMLKTLTIKTQQAAQSSKESFVFVGKRPTGSNADVYTGSVTIEGQYVQNYPDALHGGKLLFQVDDQYKTLLPKKYGEHPTWFIFDNNSDAKQMLKIDESVFSNTSICKISGKAKIVISGYTVELLESEVFDHTNLVRVVNSISPVAEICPRM